MTKISAKKIESDQLFQRQYTYRKWAENRIKTVEAHFPTRRFVIIEARHRYTDDTVFEVIER